MDKSTNESRYQTFSIPQEISSKTVDGRKLSLARSDIPTSCLLTSNNEFKFEFFYPAAIQEPKRTTSVGLVSFEVGINSHRIFSITLPKMASMQGEQIIRDAIDELIASTDKEGSKMNYEAVMFGLKLTIGG